MAGTYIRCDKDCNPVASQPKEAMVSQQVSAIEYEVFNNDYVRKPIDPTGTTTQPDLLDGWNGDFIRVKVDGTKVTGLSQIFVEQTNYKKTNVSNVVVPHKAYVRRDKDNAIVTIRFINKTDSTIVAYLADEDDRDNVIMLENDQFIVQLEDNTNISNIDTENGPIVAVEQSSNPVSTETGQFIGQ